MKKKRTIIASVVLLLVLVIGGLIAYFTDTETATNVFTIGDVDITLTEPHWDTTDGNSNNVPDSAEGRTPGQIITKDPTIENTGSNPAYVFAKVDIPCTTGENPDLELFTYTVNSGWYLMTNGTCTNGTATKVYAYGSDTAMTALAHGGTAVLFPSVTVNTAITGDESGLTGNKNLVVTGYAVQSDGLGATAPSAVWSAAGFNQ